MSFRSNCPSFSIKGDNGPKVELQVSSVTSGNGCCGWICEFDLGLVSLGGQSLVWSQFKDLLIQEDCVAGQGLRKVTSVRWIMSVFMINSVSWIVCEIQNTWGVRTCGGCAFSPNFVMVAEQKWQGTYVGGGSWYKRKTNTEDEDWNWKGVIEQFFYTVLDFEIYIILSGGSLESMLIMLTCLHSFDLWLHLWSMHQSFNKLTYGTCFWLSAL